jgi:hypothetical protein
MTIAVHQRNERDRDSEHGPRRARQTVERLLGRGIEKRRAPQRFEARFVLEDLDELVLQMSASLATRTLARRLGRPPLRPNADQGVQTKE